MKNFTYMLAVCLVAVQSLMAQTDAQSPTNAAIKLENMDKLRYRVEEDPSTGSQILAVNSLGRVTVPVSMGFEDPVITIEAKGLSVEELRVEIKKQLEGKYYKKATVKLTVVDKMQKVGQALFIGEARGVMPLPANEEVLLSTALIKLGYSEFANLKKVEVFRVDASTGKTLEPIVLNMEAVIKKGDRSKEKDLVLQDGDRVNVPEKTFLFK